jgi:hypothetical protein
MPATDGQLFVKSVLHDNEGQQREMTCALHFPCQFALAAGTIASLAPWLDLPCFGNKAPQGFKILVVEAPAFRAIAVLSTPGSLTAIGIIGIIAA